MYFWRLSALSRASWPIQPASPTRKSRARVRQLRSAGRESRLAALFSSSFLPNSVWFRFWLRLTSEQGHWHKQMLSELRLPPLLTQPRQLCWLADESSAEKGFTQCLGGGNIRQLASHGPLKWRPLFLAASYFLLLKARNNCRRQRRSRVQPAGARRAASVNPSWRRAALGNFILFACELARSQKVCRSSFKFGQLFGRAARPQSARKSSAFASLAALLERAFSSSLAAPHPLHHHDGRSNSS